MRGSTTTWVRFALTATIALTSTLARGGDTAAKQVLLDSDQATAVGYMLDSPRPMPVIVKGLAVAEGLRRRYGIDTGHPIADREAAARRAQSELLDPATFSAEQVDSMARALGFSLDPAVCGATCDNVRRLATLELQKRVLERFALDDGKPDGAGSTKPSLADAAPTPSSLASPEAGAKAP